MPCSTTISRARVATILPLAPTGSGVAVGIARAVAVISAWACCVAWAFAVAVM